MLRRMTARQLRDWEIYDEIEPFGERRADMRAALIAQTVFNMAVDKKHRLPLKDFMLKFEEKKRQTPDQQFAMLGILAAMYANPETAEANKAEQKSDVITVSAEMQEQLDKARAAMRT